ncbi:ACP phosphodiesterase [Algiphilus aromaticivorans]|uniref:ACP phosphodiesterase n=1 Tax=Algiphilus aromaticivorans TaxID=382454 RepID=UPI000694681B|nr:ACP phosphodiesterase [Algiphilus aromaticivorans]
MNFLAHLLIAERQEAEPAGALLGDAVRGNALTHLPHDVAASIRLHRRVDAVFDAHAGTRTTLSDLPAGERRWGRLTLDLYADHWLAKRWHEWHDEPLPDFCARMATAVAARRDAFAALSLAPPEPARLKATLMGARAPEGVETAIDRIAQRARRPEAVRAGCRNWRDHGAVLAPHLPAILRDCLRA